MLIIAHRGSTRNHPENSLSSIKAALEDENFNAIEFDVRRGRNGVIYLLHDRSLGRTTSHRGFLRFRHPRHLHHIKLKNDESLPTLETALQIIRSHQNGRMIFLELKERGMEEDVLDMLDKYSLRNRTVICSMKTSVLKNMHKLDPHIRLEYDKYFIFSHSIKTAKRLGCYSIGAIAHFIRKRHVEMAHKAHIKIIPYNIKSEKTLLAMDNLDVDGLCVDDVF